LYSPVNMNDIFADIVSNTQLQEGVAWKRRQVNAGEMIVRQGELGDTLFFVEEGVVRVLGNAELSDKQHIAPGLCDLGEGTVFGDVCLYEPQERTASVVALSDVRLLEISGGMLSVYLDDHPIQGYLFLKALFQTMTKRLALANDRIGHLLAWGIKAHDIDKYL
jgi:CRP/FNR family transcriptional regulator, cyclic AMP receptor protein